jgi:hypothetical protein
MDRNKKHSVSWPDWVAFGLLVVPILAGAAALGWESTRELPSATQRNFLTVAHWFDPVFFQYSLLLLVLAVLVVPFVPMSYFLTMTRRKARRLYDEIPAALERDGYPRRADVRTRLRSRSVSSFTAYFGSVSLTTVVVLLGTSIMLIFKPAASADWPGVNFGLGANMLMMGPYVELFKSDQAAYYIHLTRSLTAFQFGFLGAYVYFIGSLARAYFTLDLTPQTFVDGSIRMIGASVLALVVSFSPGIHGDVNTAAVSAAVFASARVANTQVPEPDTAGPASSKPTSSTVGELPQVVPAWNLGLLPIISFIFGFFPNWALLAMRRMTLNAVGQLSAPDEHRAMPLSILAGMSYSHEVRLEREGIENFSTADPVSLALRTGFGYRQLAQWVSEAWLAAHLRKDYPEFVRGTGITSADELQHFFATWDVARGNAVDQLAGGIQDAATSQRIKVKLAALGTLLSA